MSQLVSGKEDATVTPIILDDTHGLNQPITVAHDACYSSKRVAKCRTIVAATHLTVAQIQPSKFTIFQLNHYINTIKKLSLTHEVIATTTS